MSENYWKECVETALDEAGLSATQEQVGIIAKIVEGGHENFGMAMGYDCIPNPMAIENERLRRELSREQDKVVCPECNGVGRITEQGPYHSSNSPCDRCNGEGYRLP